MDLAKIRQKAAQQRSEAPQASTAEIAVRPLMRVEAAEQALVEPMIKEQQQGSSLVNDELFSSAVGGGAGAMPHPPVYNVPPASVWRSHYGNPLEAILAGREAAGCDEDVPLASDGQEKVQADSYEEFLCFRVSDETYGISIMEIKEIIKPRDVTEVPRAPLFVQGVISLRGTIIPIIDMRERLGLPREHATGRERVVVVKNRDEFAGLLVDEVIQVVRIPKDCFEGAPAVLDGIDRDFVSGIGRADNRLIILLNMEHVADINLY